MIKINKEILDLLDGSEQRNVLLSPILIYKTEKVAYQGKYYIKTYLYQTEDIINRLNEVRFKVSFSSNELEIIVFEFKRVESINDKNAFGCLVELPIEYAQDEFKNNYSIWISGYIVDNKVFENSKGDFDRLKMSRSDLIDKRRNYLRENCKTYITDPYFSENYWMCSCGKINSLDTGECINCTQNREIFSTILNLDDTEYSDFVCNEEFIKMKIASDSFNVNNDLDGSYFTFVNNLQTKYGIIISGDLNLETRKNYEILFDEKHKEVEKLTNLRKKQKKNIVTILPIVIIVLGTICFFMVDYFGKEEAKKEQERKLEIIRYWNGRYFVDLGFGSVDEIIYISDNGDATVTVVYGDNTSRRIDCSFDFEDEILTCIDKRYQENRIVYERTDTGLQAWSSADARYFHYAKITK